MSTDISPQATDPSEKPTGDRQSLLDRRPQWQRVLWAAMLGNIVEWYDNALYGILAVTMATTFFPEGNHTVAMISTYLGLALSYAVRPIGGAVIGRLGDTRGRKWVLTFTIVMMSVGTVGIGLIPGYVSVGVAAPILLAACRLLQGFGASAEYTTAANFLLEHAPKGRRNYLSGWSVASTSMGPFLACVAALIVINVMPSDAFDDWGWRILFLLAAPLSLLTIIIRRHTEETEAFKEVMEEAREEEVKQKPFTEAVTRHWKDMAKAIGLGAGQRVGSFMIQSYFVAALLQAGFATGDALLASMMTYIVGVPAAIWGGHVSDRKGARPLLITGYIVFAVVTVPTFVGIESGSLWFACVAVIVFTVMNNIIGAPLTTAYVMSFPPNVRNVASGLNYNIGTTLLGGSAPILASWFFGMTGTDVTFGVYMSVICLVSAAVAIWAFPASIDEERNAEREAAATAGGKENGND
jgi:MHS family proline/betaine transporter-like MFS transporter